jgi:putative aldouronate transport system substrate-binding protein
MQLSKFKKKTGLIMLMVTLVFTLIVGCSNNTNSSSNKTPADVEKKTTEKNEVTEPVKEEVVELDLFVDHSWWPIKQWSGPIPEEITKRTGVKLNITVATDDKQLPLMIASGDLPDLIFTSDNAQRLSDPNLAYSWQELIDEYAPDFQPHPDKIAVNLAPDGKYYTIRNNFSPAEEWKAHEGYALQGGADVGYRKDIWEALGSPPVNTLEDFDKLLGMVKDKYPDMVPLVLNLNWYMGYFSNNYGVISNGFYDDQGQLKFALRNPELINVYKYMNALYRKGYILPENYAFKNEDQAKELMTSGKGFAYVWTSGVGDRLNSDTAGNDKGMVFTQIGKPISDNAKIYRTDTGWSGVVITRKNKNPEKSIKLMQFLLSDEGQRLAMWGIEDQHYTMNAEGYPEFKFDKNSADVQNKEGNYWWGLLAGSSVTEALWNYVPGSETTKAGVNWTKVMEWRPEIGLVKADPDSAEQVIITNLNNMLTNEGSKALLATSEQDAEKAFQNMVDQAEKMGMAKLEAWANKEYEQIKVNFNK